MIIPSSALSHNSIVLFLIPTGIKSHFAVLAALSLCLTPVSFLAWKGHLSLATAYGSSWAVQYAVLLFVLYVALELYNPNCPWFSWYFWKVKTATVFKLHNTKIHSSSSCINDNLGIAFCIKLWFWKKFWVGYGLMTRTALEDISRILYSSWRKGGLFYQ